ncbi:hypothetical protein JX266_010704 [Neoarthrinium moseri]|nr:hypothetical protein JX266_010704 [Neoarthrinium moseri]
MALAAPRVSESTHAVVADPPAAPVRRRRQACERCWKRKNKCDKLLPSCSTCSAAGAECRARAVDETGVTNTSIARYGHYLLHPIRGCFSPGLTSSDDDRVMFSYVESLELKVQQIEAAASSAPPAKRRRLDSAVSPRQHIRNASVVYTPLSEAGSAGTNPQVADPSIRDTMGEIGFLSRSAMAEPRDERTNLPRNLALDSILQAALALDGSTPSKTALSAAYNFEPEGSSSPLTTLPRDVALAHLDRFLERVCVFYPFLDARKLKKHYEDSVEVAADANVAALPVERSLSYFSACLAIATGALMTSSNLSSSALIARLRHAALRCLPTIYDRNSLDFVHCMLYLAIFSTLSPSGGSSWHIIGLAMRACISLGLHKEPEEHLQLTDAEIDERRKLFWSAYLLDRSICLSLDRPFTVQDEDITAEVTAKPLFIMGAYAYMIAQVPARDESLEDGNASLIPHLLAQARLASSMHNNPESSFTYNYGNYYFWNQLPASLKHLAEGERIVSDILNQLACRTLVLLFKAAPSRQDLEGISGNADDVEEDVRQTCKCFLDRCYERFQELHCSGSFVDAYDMFGAAMTYISLSRRSASSTSSTLDVIHKCSTLMTVAGERFPVFRSFQSCLLSISMHLHSGGDALTDLGASMSREMRSSSAGQSNLVMPSGWPLEGMAHLRYAGTDLIR